MTKSPCVAKRDWSASATSQLEAVVSPRLAFSFITKPDSSDTGGQPSEMTKPAMVPVRALDGFFAATPTSSDSSTSSQLFKNFQLVPTSWTEFKAKLARLEDGQRRIKVAFFVRHGEGLHNEAIKIHGMDRWCNELVTSPVYTDADLTPFGIQDAQTKGPPSIKMELERGMPPIERVVVSPISRAIQTAQNFFAKDQVPDAPFMCMENCREELGVDTCNNRRSLSVLKDKFPGVDFSALKDEDDVLWTPTRRETHEEIEARAKLFLSELFESIPERNVAVVSHFGFIRAVCALTLGVDVEADKCEVVPLVLEAL